MPPGNRPQLRLTASKPGQAPGALAFYQGSQPLVDQGGPPFHAGDTLGFF